MAENNPNSEARMGTKQYMVAVGLLGFSIIAAMHFAGNHPIPENIMPGLQITAGIFHTAGRVADIVSTVRLTKEIARVETIIGEHLPIQESLTILPPRPKIKDILRPRIIALELAQAIPIILYPPIGLFKALASFYVADQNNRLRESLIESLPRK